MQTLRAAIAAAAMLSLCACAPDTGEPPSFEPRRPPQEFAAFRVFDLGVADVNSDGRLDLFTVNHNGRQSVLNNGGGWIFRDVYADMGLHQDPRFPGLEAGVTDPQPVAGTLRVHFHDRELHVTATDLGAPDAYRCRITLHGGVRVKSNGGFEVAETVEELSGGPAVRTTLTIAPPASGTLALKPEFVAAPVALAFERHDSSRRVLVGTGLRETAERAIEFSLRDRHSMAWSDVNDDGFTDVFVARGGLKGALGLYPIDVRDELFLRDGGTFRDAASAWGLEKEGRRSRTSRWHDLDGDGALDLLLGSDGDPLAVFLRRGGGFVESAAQLGLGGVQAPVFRVADLSGDSAPELLAAGETGLTIYARKAGGYAAVATYGEDASFTKIVVADFDSDGDPDALAVSPTRSLLLDHAGGSLSPVEPATLGLPPASVDAGWVDVDNDGDLDLFAHPGGLHRQTAPRTFTRDPALRIEGEQAIASWPDLDGDGTRDLAAATTAGDTALEWHLELVRSPPTRNRWLQVDLRGAAANREAVGACIRLSAGTAVQTRCTGEAEGSLYSQGHYRIYFGLGGHRGTVDLEVRWPDGRIQHVPGVRSGQLVRIEDSRLGGYDPT
jgi:hypothetical protein